MASVRSCPLPAQALLAGYSRDGAFTDGFCARVDRWLMVAPAAPGGRPSTLLYFGSAVVPSHRATSGEPKMGALFQLLLGFHTVYSRVLLDAARSRLARR